MITHKTLALPIALAAVISVMAASSQAATITWGAPTNITADTDVSTAGALVGAFNIGDTGVPGTLVNGVNFQPFELPTGGTTATEGNFTLTNSFFFSSDNTVYGSGVPPFSLLSSEYQTLLTSGTDVFVGDTLTLTITGLLWGAEYQFQFWSNFSGFGQQQIAATAGNTVILTDNTTAQAGGLGQYALGTFFGDATGTQEITFSAVDFIGALNAFQLRVTDVSGVIPEPSTVLFGLALVGACFGGRRRHRSKAL